MLVGVALVLCLEVTSFIKQLATAMVDLASNISEPFHLEQFFRVLRHPVLVHLLPIQVRRHLLSTGRADVHPRLLNLSIPL